MMHPLYWPWLRASWSSETESGANSLVDRSEDKFDIPKTLTVKV